MVSTGLQKKVKSKALTSAIFTFHKRDKHTHDLSCARALSSAARVCVCKWAYHFYGVVIRIFTREKNK